MYKRNHHKAQLGEFRLPPVKNSQEISCAKINDVNLQDWKRTPVIFSFEAISAIYFYTRGSPVIFSLEASQTPARKYALDITDSHKCQRAGKLTLLYL